MKNNLLIGLICFASFASAQTTNEYAKSAGKDYWKNRKPVEGYWQQDVHYQLNVSVDDKEESVGGKEVLRYFNNSPDTLYRVYFHLYQNAFTPGSYAHHMRISGKIKTTFGEHESKGIGTEINGLKVGGESSAFTIDNTILIIDLESPILPNESETFEFIFKTYWDKQDGGNMRRRMKTFTHDNVTHFDGVHWYPRICVYDRKFGWSTDQHLGKEFYGDFGLYEVELTFPNQYILEATGVLQNESIVLPPTLREAIDLKNYKTPRSEITQPVKANGSTKTWKYRAVNVHDFAFTADPTYRMGVVEWNGVKCVTMAQEQNAHKWQPTAAFVAKVVETYSNEIGMYGYPKIVVADARDGMEYPMVTLNSGNWPRHQYVIAHEVGHNWFFGMIGNNETYRASLDEGFTQYLTALSLKKIGKQDFYGNVIDKSVVYQSYMNHAATDNEATLNIHSDHFNSAERHGGGYSQVYFKTATMLYNLQYVLGDELFNQAIKNYFNQWKYGHPYWADFKTSVIQSTHVDLNWFFDQWLETTKTIDYKVKKVSVDENGISTIVIKRKGLMQMPLDIEVEMTEGQVEHHYIPNTYFEKKTNAKIQARWTGWDDLNRTYSFKTQQIGIVDNVRIDPSGRLADVYRLDNSKKRPISFKFSKYAQVREDYDKYNLRWHPNIWYNSMDGVKIGVDVFGVYFGNKHKINSSLWYNSGLLAMTNKTNKSPISYRIKYENRVGKLLNLEIASKWLDGLVVQQVGVTKHLKKSNLQVYAKSMYRPDKLNAGTDEVYRGYSNPRYSSIGYYSQTVNVGYVHSTSLWNTNKWNNSLNIVWDRRLKFKNGGGLLKLATRGSFLLSDYNYARVQGTLTRHLLIKKLSLKTRLFAQYGTGDFAPESQLMLSGANSENLMEKALLRSEGFFHRGALNYGNFIGGVHHGGGLNLRGFTGYETINENDSNTYYSYAGKSGLAVNVELDFSKYIRLIKTGPKFTMNTYLFGDAGILQNEEGHSGLRADAGIGTMLSWKPRRFNYIKPLNLRFDLPLFVNRIPYNRNDYFAFRFVMGISRAF